MIAAWEIAAVVGGVLGAAAWTWARKRGWGDRWDHPWTLDLALIVAGLALNLPALIGLWGLLSPYRSPMGPDSDANFLAAVALERGDLALYAGDRYPAYPGLVGALAPQASGLADTGRQFTPYALVAAADLLAVLSLLALVRGHRVATIPLALAAAVAFTADPKVPVALGLVALGLVVALVRHRLAGLLACVPLLVAVPLANALVG